jgi:hypothetical protein
VGFQCFIKLHNCVKTILLKWIENELILIVSNWKKICQLHLASPDNRQIHKKEEKRGKKEKKKKNLKVGFSFSSIQKGIL